MTHQPHPLGPVEHALLGLLWIAPRHGYDLAAEFRTQTDLGSALRVDLTDLYAALRRLERRGLVVGHLEPVGARPPRHVYQLTTDGRSEVQRWLTEPVWRNRDIRLDFILKLYFVPRLVPEQQQTLLARQLAACLEQVARLQSDLGGLPAGSFGWQLRRMRWHALRSTVAWLEELLAATDSAAVDRDEM